MGITIAAFAGLQGLEIVSPGNPLSTFVRENIETRTLDLRFNLRGALDTPRDILIVAIDERSLAEVGAWPWPRQATARLLETVSRGNPRVIALDLFFPERQNDEADRALGRAVRESGNVVMAAAFALSGEEGGRSIEQVPLWLEQAEFPRCRYADREGVRYAAVVIPTLDTIAEGALSHGHAVGLQDGDGVMRHEILGLGYGFSVYPSLALRTAAVSLGEDDLRFDGEIGVRLGGRFIPTDVYGRVLINYYGPSGSFPYVSAVDVLSGAAEPRIFENKIVYIGATGLQTYDPVSTPFTKRMPGVEKNATVTANILGDGFIRRGYGFTELLVILLGGGLAAVVLYRVRAAIGVAFAATLILAYAAFAVWIFVHYRYALGMVYPISALAFVYGTATVSRYISEEQRSREIRSLFQSYVSPKIVAELLKTPEKIRIGGDRREVTVLFSDVRGFTTFSENNEPEVVVERLNEVLSAMTDVIFSWDGTLDKFVGDEIMAFWGAPLDQPDHAERAVSCAIEMNARLGEIADRWRASGLEVLNMGIGLNTGDAIVGNIGALGRKMDYTLIGDTVNTAARIETLTRTFDSQLLLSENTVIKIRDSNSKLADQLVIHRVGTAPVKGKAEELTVYTATRRK